MYNYESETVNKFWDNGITPEYGIIEVSGINPQSAVSPQSAIYIRDRDFNRENGEKFSEKMGKNGEKREKSKAVSSGKTRRRKTSGFALIHKIEITLETKFMRMRKIKEIVKDYFGEDFQNVKTKETKGKIYKVISYKLKRGDTLAFYIYDDKIEIRAWTHKLEKTIKLTGLINGKIKRFYIELYIRYHERSERKVDTILEALLRKYGKSETIKYHMHKEKKITYINRLNKFEYKGFNISIKTYRHRAYSSLSPRDPEYHPKLEISLILKNLDKEQLLTINSKLKEIAKLLNTIRLLAKMKLMYSKYDIEQDKIELKGIDQELYKIMKGTTKRIRAINVLGKEYYDINHAILDLLKRGYKIREIARILGYDHKAIIYRIKQLEKQNIIVKIGRGKYEVKETLEKPRIIKKGDLYTFVKLYKENKINIKKMEAIEEDTDHITIYIFPTIKIERINNGLWAIDKATLKMIKLKDLGFLG